MTASWKFYTDVAIAGTAIADILAAINTTVTANSGGANAIWEVKQYVSTGSRGVLLGKKDGSAGRILIAGSAAPHANNMHSGATGSTTILYIGASPTSTANTFTDYATSSAFLDGTLLKFLSGWGALTALHELSYYECEHGIVFHTTNNSSSQTFMWAGNFFGEFPDGTRRWATYSTGTNAPAATFYTLISASGAVWGNAPPAANTTASTGAGVLFMKGGTTPTQLGLFMVPTASATALDKTFMNATTNSRSFFPLTFTWHQAMSGVEGAAGKWLNMAAGPKSFRKVLVLQQSDNAELAVSLGASDSTAQDAYWLTNFDV